MSRSESFALAAALGLMLALTAAGDVRAQDEPPQRPDWLAPFGGPHQGAGPHAGPHAGQWGGPRGGQWGGPPMQGPGPMPMHPPGPPGAMPWMPEMPGMHQMPGMPHMQPWMAEPWMVEPWTMPPGMTGPGMAGPGMMGPGMMGPGIGPEWLYGHPARPHAPIDEDHVRRVLEQRLAWHGNPRLEVGTVEAAEDGRIVAEVVTVDGSLVQRFAVDPGSGMFWQIP